MILMSLNLITGGNKMAKIKIGDKVVSIDCDGKFCGDCSHQKPLKCDLFGELIDHVVNSDINKSGTQRCQKCLNAEIK